MIRVAFRTGCGAVGRGRRRFGAMQKVTRTVTMALVSLAAVALASPAMADDRFPWLTDFDEARALAASERKPMLVVFRCEP